MRARTSLLFITLVLFGQWPAPVRLMAADSASQPVIVPVQFDANASDEDVLPDAPTQAPVEDEEFSWGDWQVRTGLWIYDRSNPPARDISSYLPFTSSFSGKTPEINAGDANFPVAVSADISLRYQGSWADVDFRYFGVGQTIAEQGPEPGVYVVSFPSSVSVALPYDSVATATSWLQSVELNLRREIHPYVAVLAGFRYVQFREQWLLEQFFDAATAGTEIVGRNELFGLQGGSEFLIFGNDRLRLVGAAKAGVFGNAASSTGRVYLQDGPAAISVAADGERGSVAFVGDVNVTVSRKLTRHVSLLGGYQLLWLGGVATATDQFPRFDEDSDVLGTTTDGSVFFHGAIVGLECEW